MTQQRDIEILVNIESGAVEFKDPKIERAVSLTPADRKWMDEIVRDVNESWDAEEHGLSHAGMQCVRIFPVVVQVADALAGSKEVTIISGQSSRNTFPRPSLL